MEQVIEFLTNHLILTAALISISAALVWTNFQSMGGNRVSPTDVTRMLSHDEAVVLDVRGDAEYEQGHILNAVHVPLDQLASRAKKLDRYKNRPVIAACRTGQASASAIKQLKSMGFTNLYQLNGGIAAWEGANLPLAKGN